MKIQDLQNTVIVEGICLLLIMLVILSAFKRWRTTLIASCILTTIAFFSAWSNLMASASMLVYGSASTLLWWQLDKRDDIISPAKKRLQPLMWCLLAVGVGLLIVHNLHSIIIYLG